MTAMTPTKTNMFRNVSSLGVGVGGHRQGQICIIGLWMEQNCRSNFGDLLLFVFSGASQSESNYCWPLPTGSRGTSSPPHGNMTS